MLSLVWQETGKDAAELFYLQQISMILRESAKVTGQVKLENVNVIDSGDGKSIASLVNAYPEIFRQFLKNVNQTLGVDVTGNFSSQNGKKVELIEAQK